MTDVAAEKTTVTITLDGRQVEARPGEMLIAAAERAGTYIPRFCYHPRMRPVGMCRMCLVQVSGPRGMTLQPSCFIPVADGMEVVTSSPEVKKAQDGILEFLLVNHPLDCPVCDKGGECPLQDQTLVYGPGETRFVEEKRHWEKPIALSDLVLLDRERCIQCDRCTRFADEVAGDPLIDFVGRGGRTEVATFPDHPFASYFSGNTVQICPVGALTSVQYRFKARPWDLEQVESTCTSCSVGCRVAVQSSSDRITRLIGLDSDPVNHGWLCDKGRYDHEAVAAPERLTAPLVRQGDQLVETSWGEALGLVAKNLREVLDLHGPSGIGVIGGARLANEDQYAWAKLVKGALRTDNVDAQIGDGLPADVVLGLPHATIDDACSASVVLLLGPDLKEELPVLHLRLRGAALADGGPAVIELGPAGTGLARHARAAAGARPGEVAELARALVADVDPTGEVAGVALDRIRSARQVLAERGDGDVVVVLGRGNLAEPAEGVAAAAVAIAEAIPGARFLVALRRGNVRGALELGLAPGLLPGRVSLDSGRSWFAERWPGVPDAAGMGTTEMLEAGAAGRLQALVLLGADPVADHPSPDLGLRGVQGAGFVVAVDTFLTESSRRADVVLPAAMWGERPGTTTNLEGRVTRLGQKVTAPGVAWPDWMIAVELAARLGVDLGFDDLDSVWDQIERDAPAFAGMTRAVLADRLHRDGVVVPVPAGGPEPSPSGPVDPMANPGVAAPPSQGAHGAGEVAMGEEAETGSVSDGEAGADEASGQDAAADGGDAPDTVGGVSVQIAVGAARPALLGAPQSPDGPELPPRDAYALRLVAARTLYDRATLTQRSPHLAGLAARATVRVHPTELERLGLRTGERVRIRSARATEVVEAVADDRVPRGSAVVPFNVDGGAKGLIDAAPVTDVRLETT